MNESQGRVKEMTDLKEKVHSEISTLIENLLLKEKEIVNALDDKVFKEERELDKME